MADQSDVENALVNLIGAAIFGSTNPVTAVPVAGGPVEVYRGWPGSIKLDATLLASTPGAVVSIYGKNGSERTTSRFPMEWIEIAGPVPTLTATVNGVAVTFGGDCSVLPINAAVAFDGLSYTYSVQANDTPTSVAAAFAASIPNATASGDVLTCASLIKRATIGNQGPAIRELRRQVKQFVVSIWSPNPAMRDAIAKAIDPPLAANIRFALPDGSGAHVWYRGSHSDDGLQRANCYRRDIMYDIEYPTTETEDFYIIVAPAIDIVVNGVTTVERF